VIGFDVLEVLFGRAVVLSCLVSSCGCLLLDVFIYRALHNVLRDYKHL